MKLSKSKFSFLIGDSFEHIGRNSESGKFSKHEHSFQAAALIHEPWV